MNDTDVSKSVLDRLTNDLEELTPQAQKAARYVLENPADVGISTVREMADAAQVKPNTLVRMARQMGFSGYEDFREPFRQAIRQGAQGFPDRARWLQERKSEGELGALYSDMTGATLANIERSFANISHDQLQRAAEAVWHSRQVFALGVGANHSIAQNFTYLASTGMKQFRAIPRAGSTAIDDLAFADHQDVLIAITYRPYRREVIEAVEIACEQKLVVIGISDSPVSPIIRSSDHGFVVQVETPQFFPSSVVTIALLEMLLSFVIAISPKEIVDRVSTFHDRRRQLGLYDDR